MERSPLTLCLSICIVHCDSMCTCLFPCSLAWQQWGLRYVGMRDSGAQTSRLCHQRLGCGWTAGHAQDARMNLRGGEGCVINTKQCSCIKLAYLKFKGMNKNKYNWVEIFLCAMWLLMPFFSLLWSQAFTIMDQNRDGFIDKNDLRDTFAALGMWTPI